MCSGTRPTRHLGFQMGFADIGGSVGNNIWSRLENFPILGAPFGGPYDMD